MNDKLPAWEELLSSASRLQRILPDAVLVGGTAAAIHLRHRVSFDADHVILDLRSRFDKVLEELEAAAGWGTARIKPPVLILGNLDGIDTGIRQLIRKEPLETEIIKTQNDETIVVPTMQEILRIKGALILQRNATRDYIDFAALADGLKPDKVCQAMARFDELYPQKNEESALMQLQIQLATPQPYDLEENSLATYKHLAPRWQNWESIRSVCIETSQVLASELERPVLESINESLDENRAL